MNTTAKTPAEAAAAADFGTPTARKSGRDPRWPYVPVLVDANGRQSQVLARAFATRAEAVADAERHVAALRADLQRKLEQPNYRALRAQYGVA